MKFISPTDGLINGFLWGYFTFHKSNWWLWKKPWNWTVRIFCFQPNLKEMRNWLVPISWMGLDTLRGKGGKRWKNIFMNLNIWYLLHRSFVTCVSIGDSVGWQKWSSFCLFFGNLQHKIDFPEQIAIVLWSYWTEFIRDSWSPSEMLKETLLV